MVNKQLKPSISPPHPQRSPCPLACALDLIGDRWTLLVIRDLFLERSTFGELQGNAENIPTNILADRLKKLVKAGIVDRRQYHQRPPRFSYHLSAKGKALGSVILALVAWGDKHLEQVEIPLNLAQLQQVFRPED